MTLKKPGPLKYFLEYPYQCEVQYLANWRELRSGSQKWVDTIIKYMARLHFAFVKVNCSQVFRLQCSNFVDWKKELIDKMKWPRISKYVPLMFQSLFIHERFEIHPKTYHGNFRVPGSHSVSINSPTNPQLCSVMMAHSTFEVELEVSQAKLFSSKLSGTRIHWITNRTYPGKRIQWK